MPIKKNAKKAYRQAEKRAVQNNIVRKTYKSAMKMTMKGISAGSKDLGELAKMAQKTLDKAAKRGVMKRKTAARKLSRLMKKVNAAKSKA